MSSVSNTVDSTQTEARPSREQCIREAGAVLASWRAESIVQVVAA
ncbi:hypothetical protein M2368_003126 [Arthrobacter sp. JUb119]|nr:hypothetical protein [Arthrobacter sp. JUb119]